MGLDGFRQRIDAIDSQLISLLAQRLDVCREVALYKEEHNLPTMQPDRVRAVLERLGERAGALGLSPDFARGLWQAIIGEACRLEDELRTELSGDAAATAPIAAPQDGPTREAPSIGVTILGAGRMGAALATILASGGQGAQLVDRVAVTPPDGARLVVGDATRLDGAAAAAVEEARCVVVALPFDAARDSIAAIARHLRRDAVVVETLSVKQAPAQWLPLLPPHVDYLGINPLFGPELAWRHRTVAVVPYRDGPNAAWVLAQLAATGAELVRLDAAEHDREMAKRQVATHGLLIALGQALAAAPAGALALSKGPPPYRVLVMTLARLLQGNPEVYAEIQAQNPFAADTRRRLAAAIDALDGTEAGIIDILAKLHEQLGPSLTTAAADCAQLFAGPPFER